MPVYEYRCKSCGTTFEIEHGFHDARPTKCERCGGVLARVFHPVGLVFKGSGFHTTDYRKPGGDSSPPPQPAESKPADGKPVQTKPAESKSPESKPKDGGSAPKPPAPEQKKKT